MKVIILLLLFLSGTVFSKEAVKEEVEDSLIDSKILRSKYNMGIFVTYSYYDFWVSPKKGILISQGDSSKAWELSYQYSKISVGDYLIDLGSISEERLLFAKRSFEERNSFNWTYGAYYQRSKFVLGDELLENISGSDTSVKALQINNIGLMWGFGNRWEFINRLSLGVDWLKIYTPIYNVSTGSEYLDKTDDDGDKSDVMNFLTLLSKTPTLAIFHFEIGYRF